ncbi:MAG TPA: hypothetical protein VGR38_08150, partial [Candidatus Polarisedimenticolia bacterium]|nr:hypothetical protein [Candidatus Polarisedimenticolia bacterium]
TYTLRDSATLRPSLFLESTVSWFDNNFAQLPNLNPDTNHNGFQFNDDRPWMGGNSDHILQARERDTGLDFDHDGAWDRYEDVDPDPDQEDWVDLDGDGRGFVGYWGTGCEGEEDLNCDGEISSERDLNLNGIADPGEDVGLECTNVLRCRGPVVAGTAGNGRLDTEDRNGNFLLDTYRESGPTSFPYWQDRDGDGFPDVGEFVSPLPGDRDFQLDVDTGRRLGPYPYQYDDHRKRFTWREDLSSYVGNLGGTHDLKAGFAWEHEGFSRDTVLRPEVTEPMKVFTGYNRQYYHRVAFLGAPSEVNNAAVAENLGFFAQDNYKPLPNLTFGIGFRVDQERVASRGFTTFDPAAERATYDHLMGLSGLDTVFYDLIQPTGLANDPLYTSGSASDSTRLSQIGLMLRTAAPRFLTRHNLLVDVAAPLLGNYFPDQGADFAGFAALAGSVRKAEEFELTNTNVAPRLSVSWDPFGDGKSKGFGSWGRFYDKLFLQSMLLELGPDGVVRDYLFDSYGFEDSTGYPNNGFGTMTTGSTLSIFQVDRNLSTPFTDELTIGFQREIVPEIALSLTYVHRDYRNQLQDVDLNHATRVNPATGKLLDTFGRPLCERSRFSFKGVCRDALVDPSLSNEAIISPPDGLPDLYIQNFLFNRVMRLGNFNAQTYRGIELELVKRLARKWQMEASYTYSKSWGDAESYSDSFGDDPSVTEFQEGYLDYDQRHVVKLNALAYLPRDWQIGGTAQWASGLPYSSIELGRISLDDVTYTQVRRRFGYVRLGDFIPENRNIHRNNPVYDFNARVQKSFVVGKASGSAFLEIFNLLNSDDLRIYEIHPNQSALQAEEERRFGRRYQVGIQINF